MIRIYSYSGKTYLMKTIFLILVIFHGLIHLSGFAEAFNIETVNQLSQHISKINGIFWLTCAGLFVGAALLFALKKDLWWMFSLLAVMVSQYLVFTNWSEAKFGTIANAFILVATVIGYGTLSFRNKYKTEVATFLNQAAFIPDSLLTETDIHHLPEPVKKYLHYTGAIGKPKVKNFKVEFSGQIRKDDQSEWMPFTSEQHNFIDASARLFFMKATMKHLPLTGFHCFKDGNAFMDIRLLSLFKVQYQAGKEMDIAETVTFFNDMCCMAPATLIDKRIVWFDAGGNKVRAKFTNKGMTISAWLQFNDKGELINFISDDRYAASENNTMKRFRWLTPMKEYKTFDGHKLAGYVEAIYAYPHGDMCYGNFRLTNIVYNYKD